jgi:hypothetical protein
MPQADPGHTKHCDGLRAAFLEGTRAAAQHRAGSLPWLIPRVNRFSREWVDSLEPGVSGLQKGLPERRGSAYLLGIEIELAVCVLLEELASAVAKEFVVGDLQFKGNAVPLVVQRVGISYITVRSSAGEGPGCLHLINVTGSFSGFAARMLASDTFLKPSRSRIS